VSRCVFTAERISVPAQRWTRRQLAQLKVRARLLGHRSVHFHALRVGPWARWDSVNNDVIWAFTEEPSRRVLSGFWACTEDSDIPF